MPSSVVTCLAVAAVLPLLAACAACAWFAYAPALARLFRDAVRRLSAADALALSVLAAVALVHGGTKSILPRFSADDGVTVTRAELTVPTNDVERAGLVYSYTGTNDVLLPLWVRQATTNEWAHLGDGWRFDARVYADGTNTVSLFVEPPASNVVAHTMYYVGTDLPPVEIVGVDCVRIDSFGVNARQATIRYTIDPSVLGDVMNWVSVKVANSDGVWVEVYGEAVMPGGSTEDYTRGVTLRGFWIDRRTRWRVELEVAK